MPVEEHHLTDVEVFGVVQGVAAEAFYQHLLPVVPKGEGVAAADNGDPLFLGM